MNRKGKENIFPSTEFVNKLNEPLFDWWKD